MIYIQVTTVKHCFLIFSEWVYNTRNNFVDHILVSYKTTNNDQLSRDVVCIFEIIHVMLYIII